MAHYLIPRNTHRAEDIIKRSRFITTLAHAPSPEEAKRFIAEIKKEFPDATHNCWAFAAGPPGDTARVGMSDDGEPGGTAGRPMLNMLLHSEVGEVAAVVTRYFGGTKLGTGGLVRAYSGMVKQALSTLKTREKIIAVRMSVIVDYANLSALRRLADASGSEIIEETYAADASLVLEMAEDKADSFRRSLIDLTNGEALIEKVSS